MTTPSFSELLLRAITDPGTISRAYTAFHSYSLGNQLLALGQCAERGIEPGPLATFAGWKAKGRHVRKGEKAIVLCMPVTIKRPATHSPDAPDTDDNPVMFTRFVFRPNWFVLSQTDGADVPAIPPMSWQKDRALAALEVTESPFNLLDGNTQGYARGRSVAVSPVAALPHKTLFHELAHVVLEHTSAALLTDDHRTPRSIREVEAEAVALLCCAALGLPGVEECRGYIQHWHGTTEPISDRCAARILRAADQILKAGAPVEVP